MRGSTARPPRKLLLPLSFGSSSSSLLYMLDQHLQGQQHRMNRVAYELLIVHVDFQAGNAGNSDASNLLDQYRSRFPRHRYICLGLEDVLRSKAVRWDMLGIPVKGDSALPSADRLTQNIGVGSSATSRADIQATLLRQLLVEVAKEQNCECILFGDSTTRLAEKTLSETAKGRGFSLPWQVCDGMSPYNIHFNYPLRDLLKKELLSFTALTSPPLTDLIAPLGMSSRSYPSSRSNTIDDLMVQYFETVEESYPSVVANVVRTASKLKPLTGEDLSPCSMCCLPISKGSAGLVGWSGNQSPASPDGACVDAGILCYGCSRSIQQSITPHS